MSSNGSFPQSGQYHYLMREIFLYCSQHTCVGRDPLWGPLLSPLTVLSGTSFSTHLGHLVFWEHDTTCYLKLFCATSLPLLIFVMTKLFFPAFKEIVHPKIKVLPVFNHPHIVPNPYTVMTLTSITTINTFAEMCQCCPLVGAICTIFGDKTS